MLKKWMTAAAALLLMVAVLPGAARAEEDDGLKITVQPESREVAYPEGASFHVEVDRPEDVASYKWELSDGYTVFELDGTSASTDTLVIPSTEQESNPVYLCCTITDKNGKKIFTEDAVLTVTNKDEDKPVLYVGGYALQPGDTLDLADTTYGSGVITFDPDGVNITLDNVRYDNSVVIFDRTLDPGMGLYLHSRHGSAYEYYIHCKGENVFNNTYFDPSINSGGVTINSHFGVADDPNKPSLIFDGDSLTVNGGQYAIYSDGEIEINTDLTINPLEEHYCDGVRGHSIFVGENAKLQLNVCGTGLIALGDLRLYPGSDITVDSIMPHVSQGPTVKSLIIVHGSMYSSGAKITLNGRGTPDNFVPYDAFIANMTGLECWGGLNLTDTKVTVDLGVEPAEDQYAINFCGIMGDDATALSMSDESSVSIRIQSPDVFGATGVNIGGRAFLEPGCRVDADLSAAGRVIGACIEGGLNLEDAVVNVRAESLTGEETAGILCGGLNVRLKADDRQIRSRAEGGTALLVFSEDPVDEPGAYSPDYEPEILTLDDEIRISIPENAEISGAAYEKYGRQYKAEAVYDAAKTEKPAEEVLITAKKDAAPEESEVPEEASEDSGNSAEPAKETTGNRRFIIGIVAGAAIYAAVSIYLRKKKK